MKFYSLVILLLSYIGIQSVSAQQNMESSKKLSLQECLKYAYQHSPTLQQTILDKEITEQGIKSRLADWYPQIGFDYSVQHSYQLQTTYFNGTYVQTGVENNSLGQFSLTQNIFNSDALLASSTAKQVRKQATQNIASSKIDLEVNIGKAFYNVLFTKEQLNVLDENIVRLNRSLEDAYNQYESGIVDKVDYKRATIALNNTKAQKKTAEEMLKAKYAYLKMQMGYPDSAALNLDYDVKILEASALIDTSHTLDIENRIEYQLLLSKQHLQLANYKYYKWKFLPTVQAYGNYNLNYLNNDLGKLYNTDYPYSYAGVRVGVPLFQGFRRLHNMKQAKLQLNRMDYDMENLRNSVNAEYVQNLAVYKGYLNDYYNLKENMEIAKDVFNTIELQYKAGIKTYLEVITAQTDLRTAELNYTNALYQLLGSKLDVQKALGAIIPN